MPERTHVLFINSPFEGGADTWVQALLMRSLDRSRFDVHVACAGARRGIPSPATEALRSIPGLRLLQTEFGPSLSGLSRGQQLVEALRALPAAASLVRLVRYIRRHDIRILHSSDRPRDVFWCALLARLTGARSVIHVHVKFDRWIGRGVRYGLARADALIGVSAFVARSLQDAGYPTERTHVVLNAVVLGDWDPSLPPQPARAELGIAPDAPAIVSVSRLFRWKGHGELLRAVALVRRELPGVRLVIVGRDHERGATAELQALARALDLEQAVIFTGQRGDVARLIAAGDVFALASFEEPFGLVFAEAMALGRPVVGLDNGGTPEVVDHGGSGLLSPPDDVPGLAENLLRLLRDPGLRARMGAHGRGRVEARFTPEQMARGTERVYAQLLGP